MNNDEIFYEVETSPQKLRELIERLTALERQAYPGQVIRIKLDQRFCFVYRPHVKHNFVDTIKPPERNPKILTETKDNFSMDDLFSN